MVKLIADIGGTNIRLAAFRGSPLTACQKLLTGTLAHERHYRWDEVTRLETALDDFITHFALPARYDRLVVAYAGLALEGQEVFTFTNRAQTFTRTSLGAYADQVYVLNDFAAQASLIPHLPHNQIKLIKEGKAHHSSPRAVLGPGTGLGVAGLTATGQLIAGEGGNVALPYLAHAPLTALIEHLGPVGLRLEDVLSGPGLENIYTALGFGPLAAHQISAAAHQGPGPERQALELFFDYAALACANQALQYAAAGGVYLVGNIANHNVDLLDLDRFAKIFCATRTHVDFLTHVPVYLVQAKTSGLAGAAAYLAAC